MKLIVNPHKIEIEKTPVNEKEIDITKVQFEFTEEITPNYVKDAYFTYNGTTYKVLINNNECSIPYEVLNKQGMVEIGVVAYLVEDETEIKRYNPSPVYISTLVGSLKDQYENTEPITPTDKEQIEQLLQDGLNDIEEAIDRASNLDVDAEKVDKTTTITITKQDGTQETTEINDGIDGISLQYNWNGTNLGIKREDEQNYEYVNLKGEKGDAGSIKIIIVNELPLVGEDDTIYLMPYEDAEQGNIYKEYIYINGTWEELGSIPVEVDLSDYYTKSEVNALIPDQLSDLQDDSTHRLVTDTEKTTWNSKVGTTDYATNVVGGVIKTNAYFGLNMNSSGTLIGQTKTYAEYNDVATFNQYGVICKGTLENVITGKGLVSNTDYAGQDIAGVIKAYDNYGTSVDNGRLRGVTRTYEQYQSANNLMLISKVTLENVLNARIGDINTALDTINGEVI